MVAARPPIPRTPPRPSRPPVRARLLDIYHSRRHATLLSGFFEPRCTNTPRSRPISQTAIITRKNYRRRWITSKSGGARARCKPSSGQPGSGCRHGVRSAGWVIRPLPALFATHGSRIPVASRNASPHGRASPAPRGSTPASKVARIGVANTVGRDLGYAIYVITPLPPSRINQYAKACFVIDAPRMAHYHKVCAPLTPPSHAWRHADIVWAMDRSIGWTGQPG